MGSPHPQKALEKEEEKIGAAGASRQTLGHPLQRLSSLVQVVSGDLYFYNLRGMQTSGMFGSQIRRD